MAALYEPPSTPEKSQRVFHQKHCCQIFLFISGLTLRVSVRCKLINITKILSIPRLEPVAAKSTASFPVRP